MTPAADLAPLSYAIEDPVEFVVQGVDQRPIICAEGPDDSLELAERFRQYTRVQTTTLTVISVNPARGTGIGSPRQGSKRSSS